MHLYFADDLKLGQTDFDFDEDIEIFMFSSSEIELMIKENKIVDSKTISIYFKAKLFNLVN